MPWWIVTFAFCCGFLMDVVWNRLRQRRDLQEAPDGRQLQRLLYLCTVVSTVLIVEKCIAAVAAYIVGGWLGTYLVVALPRPPSQ